MLPQSTIRSWARRLIASEISAHPPSAQEELATLRAYEKLRSQLCAPVGVDAFQALASRALSQAKSQSPQLSTAQITANGGLSGLGEIRTQAGASDDCQVGVILIAQLIKLFVTLLGEAATIRLIGNKPDENLLEAKSEPAETGTSATGASYFGTFQSILLEADQLRKVSERLEILVDKHGGIDEVMSVAGNIRNIAAVLDVFTVIRSKANTAGQDVSHQLTHGYVN